ncbi:MAG: hypothetical protein EXR51_04570 [Dehalococcoidia bacterium]|nr:hypothetical protein [Dehalococcoidia bacterium]
MVSKIGVTNWLRANTEIQVVWQWNDYEHIIRDEPDLERIRSYIEENPLRWNEDDENPGRVAT